MERMEFEGAITFGDGCGCDHACGITRVRSFLGMDVGAIVLVGFESAIAFGDGCGCDRTCGI